MTAPLRQVYCKGIAYSFGECQMTAGRFHGTVQHHNTRTLAQLQVFDDCAIIGSYRASTIATG